MAARWRKVLKVGVAAGAGVLGLGGVVYVSALVKHDQDKEARQSRLRAQGLNKRPSEALPSRDDQLKSLASEHFDVLVIGGGATGAGCALDAQSRGLKTALVELDDFSSGTSSRSTKLIHGGVRYLQKAIMG